MIEKEKATLVTTSWDDGHPLDLRLAAMLAKHGVAATFYIPRKSAQPVMDKKQIVTLGQAFEIGAHTLDHTCLDHVSDREAAEQLAGSRRWIEDVTSQSCRLFCFPGGKYKNRQLPLVSQAGFLAARTVEFLSLLPPVRRADLLLIPTSVQAFPHRPAAHARNALKRRAIRPFCSGDLPHSRDWVALAKRLFLRALRDGGVFHLWGHSWEIEQRGLWQHLAELLAFIGQHRPHLRFVTNGELCAGRTPARPIPALPAQPFNTDGAGIETQSGP